MAITITQSMEWNHIEQPFIDTMITQSNLLNRFRIVDDVKSTTDVPINGFIPHFHNDLCVFDPQNVLDQDTKQMSVTDWRADFSNCKGIIEQEWNSVLLGKGSLLPEVLNQELEAWVFERMAKEFGKKLITQSVSELTTAIDSGPDAGDVTKFNIAAPIDSTNILTVLNDLYEAMPDTLLEAIYGDSDRSWAPVILMGSKAYRAYNIAVAAQTNSYDLARQADGSFLPYFGMEVIHYPQLGDDRVWCTTLQNLVLLTDDLSDMSAIQSDYTAKTNTLDIWAQGRFGFDFRVGSEIVAGHTSYV
jgi:hypothetical protein